MSRLTATDRLRRLLAVIPWVAGHDRVPIDEVCQRFAYPRRDLIADLQDVVYFVGVHPFTPDTLIEVEIDDDHVSIDYADYFSRPLRLEPAEALQLFAAGATVLALEDEATPDEDGGADEPAAADRPLLRALTKLAGAMSETGEAPVEVRLGAASGEALATIRQALADRRLLELDYYSYGRDERSRRAVEPRRLFAREGRWYLQGWCRRAEGERIFRVDRMLAVSATEEEVPEGTDPEAPAPLLDDAEAPRLTLVLGAADTWVLTSYPHDEAHQDAHGVWTVRLPVTSTAWFERLMLRLSDEARVVDADPRIDLGAPARAARRILDRYA